MGIFPFVIFAIIAFIGGVICTLLLEYYVFKKYLENAEVSNQPPKHPVLPGRAELPDELVAQLKDENFISGTPNENLAINLTLQFLFNELRNAERVRLWLYKKLNNEFKELVNQTTTGKLFDSVQVCLNYNHRDVLQFF